MPPLATSAKLRLTQANTQQILVNGLQDQVGIVNGTFLSDGVFLATLLDENRTVVAQCQNIALEYVPGSNGDYVGIIEVPFTPAVGTEYTMIVDGDADGGSSHLHLELPTEIKVRVR